MPTETLTNNAGAASEVRSATAGDEESALRSLALKHIERMRRLRLHIAAYVLGMVVLTPVWVLTEYLNADGWPERLSDNSNAGDWNPWILWVVLIWGAVVAAIALRTYFDRPITEEEIEREVERLRPR